MKHPLLIPEKLHRGDRVSVLALSRSLGGVMRWAGLTEVDIEFARQQLQSLGLQVLLGRHTMDCNEHLTASIEARLEDLHGALSDPSVKGILAVSGGVGALQMLGSIDYSLFGSHPKILCGYSDIAFVCNAVYAQTGVVTYYGPNFTSFMMRQGGDYARQGFQECLFGGEPLRLLPAAEWSDDNWVKDQENRTWLPNDGFWPIQEGEAEGTIVGGSSYCLNMLQGSNYFPLEEQTILFLERPAEGKATLMSLDNSLRALSFQPGFRSVRGIVLGRYARSEGVNREKIVALVQNIPALAGIPIVANCDFGHTTPMMTIPIGGQCCLQVGPQETEITLTQH
jgi:muramoyltetrapeptide carboxypeptidase